MSKICEVCGNKIPFWKFSKIINGKLHCHNCFSKHETKIKVQKEKIEVEEMKKRKIEKKNKIEASKDNYKSGLITIGIIIICITYYFGFLSDSGYYNKISNQKYTIYEAKKLCDNPLTALSNYDTPNVCGDVNKSFFISTGIMIFGVILLFIGIIQNLIIYNYNLNK